MISIIIPVYAKTQENVEWLRYCLLSLENQSFQEFEVVIVDDASPADITPLKSHFLGPKYRFFANYENSGPSRTRNTAVNLAQYDAILPLDYDDLLPEGALERMWMEYQKDNTKIVYGDIQLYEKKNNEWQLGQIILIKDYNFDNTLKTNGAIPVTALHSKECHYASGGWKEELEYGFEDVEKWIAAGRAGFCGVHLNYITLLYRKHNTSRFYNLRNVNRQEAKMKAIIETLHSDVYRGFRDMGCCGGSNSSYSPNNGNGQQVMVAQNFNDIPDNEKVWFRYNGSRKASFGMKGGFTKLTYTINGNGFEFPVHEKDAPLFRRTGRGLDFTEVPSPLQASEPEIKVQELPRPYQAPEPKLSILQRLDELARRQVPVEVFTPNRPMQASEVVEVKTMNLKLLGLGPFVDILQDEWSIEDLAHTTPDKLTTYPGIGPKRAEDIILTAKNFLI